MKLARLKLSNFQAHKRLTLKLDPAVTILTGRSDCGKSAVIRALRWLCLNDFAGASFIRKGATWTKVSLRAGGKRIVRSRGRKNLYKLDGKSFAAFGSGVPDEVSDLLRLSPDNFSDQHDGPFWFNQNASEVSRRLNAVVDLSMIDLVLSGIGKKASAATTNLQFCRDRLASAKEEWKILKPQRARTEAFLRLSSLNDDVKERSQLISALAQIVETARRLKAARKIVSFDGVAAAFDKWAKIRLRCFELASLMKEIEDARDQVQSASRKAESSAKVFHKRVKGSKCPICGNLMK